MSSNLENTTNDTDLVDIDLVIERYINYFGQVQDDLEIGQNRHLIVVDILPSIGDYTIDLLYGQSNARKRSIVVHRLLEKINNRDNGADVQDKMKLLLQEIKTITTHFKSQFTFKELMDLNNNVREFKGAVSMFPIGKLPQQLLDRVVLMDKTISRYVDKSLYHLTFLRLIEIGLILQNDENLAKLNNSENVNLMEVRGNYLRNLEECLNDYTVHAKELLRFLPDILNCFTETVINRNPTKVIKNLISVHDRNILTEYINTYNAFSKDLLSAFKEEENKRFNSLDFATSVDSKEIFIEEKGS